jgi:hypothetical protein
MGLALATKVKVEHRTSSPGCTPIRRTARCSAAVPELRQAAARMPVAAHTSSSKAVRWGPAGAIQLVAKASSTKRRSSAPMSGGER